MLKDRISQYPNRRKLKIILNANNEIIADFERYEGTITEAGSMMNARTLLDNTYPVGAIYISTVNTSPVTLFGGNWVALESRFLVGASASYPANSTGGNSTMTLTTANLPAHSHTNTASTSVQKTSHNHRLFSSAMNYSGNCVGIAGKNAKGIGCVEHDYDNGAYDYYNTITYGDRKAVENAEISLTATTTIYNASTGSGIAVNNIPPYLSVFMWKRTA